MEEATKWKTVVVSIFFFVWGMTKNLNAIVVINYCTRTGENT